MTLQRFGGIAYIPAQPLDRTLVPAYTGFLIDASTEKVAFVIQAPKAGTLDKAELRLGTVTQAPVNGIRVSFQDLSLASTPAVPDGTQDQFRDVTAGLSSNAWLVPGLMTSDGTDGGVKRTVARGDFLAVVIEFTSFSAGDSLNIANVGNASVAGWSFPYTLLNTGAWASQNNTVPLVVLKYDDGTYASCYGDLAAPASALSSLVLNTGTTPDEIALRFKLPAPAKAAGFWHHVDTDGDHQVILYDDSSNVLTSLTVDKDARAAGTSARTVELFPAEVDLAANTWYRLAIKPTTVTSLTAYYFDVAAAAIMDAIPLGQNCYWSERTDGGAWTDTVTRRLFAGLQFSAFDDGVAATVGDGPTLLNAGLN